VAGRGFTEALVRDGVAEALAVARAVVDVLVAAVLVGGVGGVGVVVVCAVLVDEVAVDGLTEVVAACSRAAPPPPHEARRAHSRGTAYRRRGVIGHLLCLFRPPGASP
jgi:hypothetical protein